jgi:hypothetical protein
MKRNFWELPEIVVVAILTAVSALALGGLASGIAGSVEASNPFVGGVSTTGILVQSTTWADSFAAFMVLIGLLVIWWHVETWSEVIDSDEDVLELEEDQSELGGGEEVRVGDEPSGAFSRAFRHVMRGRVLAAWAGISTLVVVASAIVNFVSYQIDLESSDGGMSPVVWQLRALQIGSLAATLVLGAAGVLGTIWVRRLCSSYLTVPMEEEDEMEG